LCFFHSILTGLPGRAEKPVRRRTGAEEEINKKFISPLSPFSGLNVPAGVEFIYRTIEPAAEPEKDG